ncbi:MAG: serine/threonine-protein kinase [Planctomycetota bacterium]
MNNKTQRDDETIDLSATKAGDSTNFSVGEGTGAGGPFDGRDFPIQLGRYQLTGLLGRGGMGAVYLANDQQLERDVALKVPKFGSRDNEKAIKRFYREARAAATVTHPNLCPVYDVAEIDGVHCIAMAFIDGKPLSSYIDANKPPDPKVAATIIRKVALAMEEAHQKKIVHRDLKPANIMIDKRKEPIVMDFGLACPSETGDETRLTQDGAIIGSPAYMSPEQLKGDPKQIGPSSDQYSLGIVLYELICGTLPFENASSTITLLSNILTQAPRPIETMRDGLAPRLINAVNRAIAKEPSERFSSMKDLANELGKYIRDVPASNANAKQQLQTAVRSTPVVSGAPNSTGTSTVQENQFDNLPPIPSAGAKAFKGTPAGPKYLANQKGRGRKLNKSTLSLIGLGAAILVAAGAYMATDSTSRETSPSDDGVAQEANNETAVTAALSNSTSNDSSAIMSNDSEMTSTQITIEDGTSRDASNFQQRSPLGPGRENRRSGESNQKSAANQLLRRWDRNQDDQLGRDELPPHDIARLMEGDTNSDGFLDRAEIEAMPEPLGPPPLNGQDSFGPRFGGPRFRGPGPGRPNQDRVPPGR